MNADHNRLLQEAINAARAVAWRGNSDDLAAERDTLKAYFSFCERHGLEPYPVRVTS